MSSPTGQNQTHAAIVRARRRLVGLSYYWKYFINCL
jgi:hypothetical protein